MEEKIRELYSKIREMGASFVIYHKRSSVEQIKEIMPDIQEFVLWFLEGNRFGIEEQFYKDMSNNIFTVASCNNTISPYFNASIISFKITNILLLISL